MTSAKIRLCKSQTHDIRGDEHGALAVFEQMLTPCNRLRDCVINFEILIMMCTNHVDSQIHFTMRSSSTHFQQLKAMRRQFVKMFVLNRCQN